MALPLRVVKPPVRIGQFSLMRSLERIACAVIQGAIIAWMMRHC